MARTSPCRTIAAADLAIALLASDECRIRISNEPSSPPSTLTAPPRTRRSRVRCSRPSRSLRMVTVETPNVSARSLTTACPDVFRIVRMACSRANSSSEATRATSLGSVSQKVSEQAKRRQRSRYKRKSQTFVHRDVCSCRMADERVQSAARSTALRGGGRTGIAWSGVARARRPSSLRCDSGLAAARQGSGRLVLVSGESGVGKSSLVQRFTAASNRVRVLYGVCDGALPARPLGPLTDIADDLGSAIAAAAPRRT